MNKENNFDIKHWGSKEENEVRTKLIENFRNCPIPDDQILSNLQLFINSKNMARILFMDHIYRQIIDVMGVVMEFGTRWGPNISQFAALRGIYEPFNRHRKLIAFDTFTGFSEISKEDGKSSMMEVGHLQCTTDYKDYLDKVLACQEGDNPLSHIKKYELIKGDACMTVPKYISDNPETIIALAYFDFDVYKPTKQCLETIKPRLVKGSVVAFDELNDTDSPGETLALLEVIGLNNVRLKRHPNCSRTSYFIYE